MKRIFPRLGAATLAVALTTGAGQAQQLLAEYYTTITGADLSNSRGVPLGDFCAIVQQDRANFHRFGIRHGGDQSDPIFHDRNKRAQIAATCALAPGSEYVPGSLAQYGTKFIWVRVYGSGGWPTLVLVSEGAG